VKRRELLLLLGGMMTTPRALRAQQKAMPVIGYLNSASPGLDAASVAAFRQGLSETGYVEGQNLAIEYSWAEGRYDRLPALAADLVGGKVDLIVTSGGTPPARAAKMPPRRSRSFSWVATRSRTTWSPVSPGQAVTSPA
jgi:putative ABC transport system substrate-binding protein